MTIAIRIKNIFQRFCNAQLMVYKYNAFANFGFWLHYIQIDTTFLYSKHRCQLTLPLLAGDLRSFVSSPALLLWYLNLPLFTSTNTKYFCNTSGLTTLSRVIILENFKVLIRHPCKTKIKHRTDYFRRFL